jgi:hypothetical protein
VAQRCLRLDVGKEGRGFERIRHCKYDVNQVQHVMECAWPFLYVAIGDTIGRVSPGGVHSAGGLCRARKRLPSEAKQ